MHKRLITASAAAALLAALGGCFGGDDDEDEKEPAVTEKVPDTASASSAGFIDYLKELVTFSGDGLEPVDISAVTPPIAENEEPTPLD